MTVEDLTTPDIVFHFGLPPQRIDILTSITGVEFEEGWAGRTSASFDGVPVSILGRVELLKNKRSTGRPKDTLDADDLERLQS